MIRKLILLVCLFCTTAAASRANKVHEVNNLVKKNEVEGGVVEAATKKPIGNVSITAYSTSKKECIVWTNDGGNYSFNSLKPGTYKLVFEKEGYKTVTKEKVVIRPDEACQVNIEMTGIGDFQIIPGQLIFSDFN